MKMPGRHWFRFSLKTLLSVMLIAMIGMGWFRWRMDRAKERKAAVEFVRSVGGWVWYDYEADESGMPRADGEPSGPEWWREFVGEDFDHDVIGVSSWYGFYGLVDSDMEKLQCLTELKFLNLRHAEITDAGMVHLEGMTNLRVLTLDDTQVTDEGLRHLEGLKQLRKLSLVRTRIGDEGLRHLSRLESLEKLDLSDTAVSDAGLEALYGLTELRELSLYDDRSMRRQDSKMRISLQGVERLEKKLPNCNIMFYYDATDSDP